MLAAELSTIAQQVRSNAQAAAPVLLGNALSAGVLGRPIELDQPAYLWAFAATSPLGHQRVALAVLPLVVSWVGVAALAIAVTRVAGAWAGSLALALGIGAAPLALFTEMAAGFHGVAWCFTGLLGLLVVAMAKHRPRRLWLALWTLAGLVAGAAAAVDHLLLVTAVLPLVVAQLWQRIAQRRRQAVAGLLTVTGGMAAGFGAVALLLSMSGYNTWTEPAPGLTSSIAANTRTVGRGLLDLANGLPTSGRDSPLALAAAIAVLVVGLAAVAAVTLRALRSGGHRDGRAANAAPTGPNAPADGPASAAVPGATAEPARASAHVIYWVSSAVLLLLATLLGNVAGTGVSGSPASRFTSAEHLLTGLLLSAAALVPLWPRRPMFRALAAGVATLVIAASAVRVAAATIDGTFQPAPSQALPALQESLAEHGLTHGYASPASALPLRLVSNGALDVLPAAEGNRCGRSDPGAMCRDLLGGDPNWFTGRAGMSFVVVDPGDPSLAAAPSLGPPVQMFSVDRFTVYVYSADVLEAFAATCAGPSDHRCTP